MARQEASSAFTIEGDTVRITAQLRGGGPPGFLDSLSRAIRPMSSALVKVDISQLTELDSLGGSLLAELVVRGHIAGKDLNFIGASPAVERGLARYFYPAPEVRLPEERRDRIAGVGAGAYRLWDALGDLLLLASESIYWSAVALWRSDGHRKGAVTAQALLIGVGALPVVLTISFLIGIVITLQSADLVKQWGANIFVADGLVVGMFREMGPLMTAILLAGRSGAAIAAEIATMVVSEEMDALQVMGLSPMRYVVVPKVWGITLTAPFVSIFACLTGVFGGFLVCVTNLDLTPTVFFREAVSALDWYDFLTGNVKTLVFAWLIVIISSYFGLNVKGGAEGVGRATTASVVATIFAVIVADAGLGLLFYL